MLVVLSFFMLVPGAFVVCSAITVCQSRLDKRKTVELELTEDFEQLRWFPLPAEILAELQTTGSRQTRHTTPP